MLCEYMYIWVYLYYNNYIVYIAPERLALRRKREKDYGKSTRSTATISYSHHVNALRHRKSSARPVAKLKYEPNVGLCDRSQVTRTLTCSSNIHQGFPSYLTKIPKRTVLDLSIHKEVKKEKLQRLGIFPKSHA